MAEKHAIISQHTGKIKVLVKGVNVEIDFEEKDGKGVAKVDAAVRDVLLTIPGYAKPGSRASASKTPEGDKTPEDKTPEDKKPEGGELSKERYATIKNVKELEGLLPECNSQELLMELIVAESEKKDTRVSYTGAMQKRLDELQNANQ
ncbi:hypothetical protein KAR91_37370 [Candidatus Pacearchaeota archaeon]|nr:hypothetical protein [Candidatus Pacearchaeota archaeon]